MTDVPLVLLAPLTPLEEISLLLRLRGALNYSNVCFIATVPEWRPVVRVLLLETLWAEFDAGHATLHDDYHVELGALWKEHFVMYDALRDTLGERRSHTREDHFALRDELWKDYDAKSSALGKLCAHNRDVLWLAHRNKVAALILSLL